MVQHVGLVATCVTRQHHLFDAGRQWRFTTVLFGDRQLKLGVTQLQLTIAEKDGRETPLTASIEQVVLAGYTGRDQAHVLDHIHELEKLGVAPPPSIPMVYVVPPQLLTTADSIAV